MAQVNSATTSLKAGRFITSLAVWAKVYSRTVELLMMGCATLAMVAGRSGPRAINF
jgi:hypothetical protein